MICKIRKIFLVFGVIIFISCFNGCVVGGGNDCVSSHLHMDIFYNKVNDRIVDNKVVIGMGNSIYDPDGNAVAVLDDYYQGFINICISVFGDNDNTAIDKIEIQNSEFFSLEYSLKSKYRESIDDYRKTWEFNITDYDIKEYIKFAISYDWKTDQSLMHISKILSIYGEFIDDEFIVKDILDIKYTR